MARKKGITATTRKDLITAIAMQTGTSKKEVAEIIATYEDLIKQQLKNGNRVLLAGFVTLIPKEARERKAYIPKKGEHIIVAPRRTVIAKFSKQFKNWLNK